MFKGLNSVPRYKKRLGTIDLTDLKKFLCQKENFCSPLFPQNERKERCLLLSVPGVSDEKPTNFLSSGQTR